MSSVEKTCENANTMDQFPFTGGSGDIPDRANYDPIEDNQVTVVGFNIPYSEDENLFQKAADILHSLGEDVSSQVHIQAVVRLRQRYHDKPGLVKISFENTEQKILILKNKRKLRNSCHSEVFIKPAKTYIERLVEANARAILRELPKKSALRVNANGRIQARKSENNPPRDHASEQHIEGDTDVHP